MDGLNLAYHDQMLTVLYDKTGQKYGNGHGLRVLADRKEIDASKTLVRLTVPHSPAIE